MSGGSPAREPTLGFLAHTSDPVFTVHAGLVSSWNAPATALLGWSAAEATGRTPAELLRPAGDSTGWDAFVALLDEAPPEGGPLAEVAVADRNGGCVRLGGVVWNEGAGSFVLLRNPDTDRLAEELKRDRLELASDATELWHRAFHDPLTNLANRNLFRQRAEEALARAPGQLLAVLLLDIDGLKTVNDALGQSVGDRLIVSVADRLRRCVGASGTVARPGGDEFAILLDQPAHEEEATAAASSVIAVLADPFEIDGRILSVSATVGWVVTDGRATDVGALLHDADVALFWAKSHGRGTSMSFEHTMHAAALDRLELEGDLRRAIQDGGLDVHFQPIADLRSGEVVCVEALVRWTHPSRGPMSPADFIPLAEDTGLIVALGEWVLRAACRQTQEWHRRYPDRPPVSVAVNLSGIQLQLPAFGATVAAVLEETGLRADNLLIEITESQVVENIGTIEVNLQQLQALGVRLSIDDFGTGYSSLGRLRTMPVDELKIDRSFVQEIEGSTQEAPLVEAVVAMAHSLDLHVVGEGVETAEQLQFLLRAGCDRAQGFLLARPAPADAVEALIVQPMLVLRLAAAAAALGDTAERLDMDVLESLASVLAEAGGPEELVDGLLALVVRITGLEAAYTTRIHWDLEEQEVLSVHGRCPIGPGHRFSWAGAPAPDVYGDARLAEAQGMRTYISVPVTGPSGGLFGTLCAVSSKSRVLTRAQLAALELLARIAADETAPWYEAAAAWTPSAGHSA